MKDLKFAMKKSRFEDIKSAVSKFYPYLHAKYRFELVSIRNNTKTHITIENHDDLITITPDNPRLVESCIGINLSDFTVYPSEKLNTFLFFDLIHMHRLTIDRNCTDFKFNVLTYTINNKVKFNISRDDFKFNKTILCEVFQKHKKQIVGNGEEIEIKTVLK